MPDVEFTRVGEDLLLSVGGRAIGEYRVDDRSIEAVNTPKPYFHPLRTHGGTILTGFAPADHPWHHGLQFAMPRVGVHNLWGGGTYFGPERGYAVEPDHGAIRHRRWLDVDDATGRFRHRVVWVGHDGTELIEEDRAHRLRLVTADGTDGWRLDLDTTLRNVTNDELRLETPAQRGRPDGGYGGWFLRFADGFTSARLTGDGAAVAASGATATALVIDGRTGSGESVTVAMHQGPVSNPGVRKYLYRFEPFALAGFAVAYDEGLSIAPNGALRFSHSIACFDGSVDDRDVVALLREE